ncbi:hypothetical protein PoB_002631500 [Plakobranchus ocellatus]|uniref:Uncharacterized protein n=1 Tax=Plakobranchus ocellatus TaxID=259542 RepID=A0AAV3ZX90_9GAST|nr:hypothetical protein PoB_002631500 [Plakobranchus ocellatus]
MTLLHFQLCSFMYEYETRRTNEAAQKKIQTFYSSCLRPIFNIRWPERIKNKEMWEQASQTPERGQIKRRGKRLKWTHSQNFRKFTTSITSQALLGIRRRREREEHKGRT